jgi:hypothetical protein
MYHIPAKQVPCIKGLMVIVGPEHGAIIIKMIIFQELLSMTSLSLSF